VQVKVYAEVDDGVTDVDPDVVWAPDQLPDAVQDVALVDDQDKVEDNPALIVVGLAEIDTVGAGGGGGGGGGGLPMREPVVKVKIVLALIDAEKVPLDTVASAPRWRFREEFVW
jgi:hypothetical protein